jgi:acylphosphatase
MMKHVEISFKSSFYEDGFGFACMKMAYSIGVTGKMDYGAESDVTIQAEGDESKLAEFLQWIETNVKDPAHLIVNNTLKYSGKYNEFDIYLNAIRP